MDIVSYEVYLRDRRLPLTAREFEIVQLLFVISQPGLYARGDLREGLGYDAEGSSATVTEHIKNIRAKFAEIDPDQVFISTVWGVGYRWARAGE